MQQLLLRGRVASRALSRRLSLAAPQRAALSRRPVCVQAVLEVPSSQPSTSAPSPLLPWMSAQRRRMGSTGSSAPVPPPSAQELEALAAIEAAGGPLDSKPMVPGPQPVVVVISGPSGVGKDSVLQRLKEKREDLYFVVTATSRAKRPGEVEGKDYFFVDKARFESWIAEGQLLEHAVVYGEYKGIPRQQVDQALAAGTDVVLRIDVQGAATVRRLMPHAVSIFIAADSERELVTRLVGRKTESADRLAVRVGTAREEVARIREFDYVVVNRDGQLEECVDQIAAIIDAEKLRVSKWPAGWPAGAAAAAEEQQQQQQQQQ